MDMVASLLTKIDEFLRDSGMAETAFGLAALNDGKFVSRLRGGSGVTVKTINRVNSYIDTERAKLDTRRGSRPEHPAQEGKPAPRSTGEVTSAPRRRTGNFPRAKAA